MEGVVPWSAIWKFCQSFELRNVTVTARPLEGEWEWLFYFESEELGDELEKGLIEAMGGDQVSFGSQGGWYFASRRELPVERGLQRARSGEAIGALSEQERFQSALRPLRQDYAMLVYTKAREVASEELTGEVGLGRLIERLQAQTQAITYAVDQGRLLEEVSLSGDVVGSGEGRDWMIW